MERREVLRLASVKFVEERKEQRGMKAIGWSVWFTTGQCTSVFFRSESFNDDTEMLVGSRPMYYCK